MSDKPEQTEPTVPATDSVTVPRNLAMALLELLSRQPCGGNGAEAFLLLRDCVAAK